MQSVVLNQPANEEMPLDAIRQLVADYKSYINYGYDWKAKRGILPNEFGRTRQGATQSIGCLIAKRRGAGKDFAISEAGLKLLVEREGADGAPKQCFVLLRDETGALINSTLARALYSKLKGEPTLPPGREGFGRYWWIGADFNSAASRKEDEQPF